MHWSKEKKVEIESYVIIKKRSATCIGARKKGKKSRTHAKTRKRRKETGIHTKIGKKES